MENEKMKKSDKSKMSLNLTKRDLKWLISILFAFIIIIGSHWILGSNDDVFEYFSFMSIVVSITLAIVAIWISIYQNMSTSMLNSDMKEMLTRIDTRVERIDLGGSGIAYSGSKDEEVEEQQEKEEQQEQQEQEEQQLKNSSSNDNYSEVKSELMRYHGYIATNEKINSNQLVNYITNYLEHTHRHYQVIDYSVFGSINVINQKRGFLTNFLIIVSGSPEEGVLKDSILTSLNKLNINDIGLDLKLNRINKNFR